MSIFRGGWLIIVGAFALFSPPISLFALAMFFATAVFISAGVLLTNGAALRSPLPIAQGMLSLAVAATVAFLPRESWQTIVVAISLWAIAMGAVDILSIARHRKVRGRSYLYTAAAVSIAGGVLGLVVIALGPSVVTWFFAAIPVGSFGILALIAGGSLIGYGLRRRRRKGPVAAANAAHSDEERRSNDPSGMRVKA